jgi:hypothetical protein
MVLWSELKKFSNEKPFNDLWPPTDLGPGYYYPTYRSLWFHWLIRGWVNGTPYRDLKIGDYNPRKVAYRQEQRARKRREAKENARKRYCPKYKRINVYRLRKRWVVVWKLVRPQD